MSLSETPWQTYSEAMWYQRPEHHLAHPCGRQVNHFKVSTCYHFKFTEQGGCISQQDCWSKIPQTRGPDAEDIYHVTPWEARVARSRLFFWDLFCGLADDCLLPVFGLCPLSEAPGGHPLGFWTLPPSSNKDIRQIRRGSSPQPHPSWVTSLKAFSPKTVTLCGLGLCCFLLKKKIILVS